MPKTLSGFRALNFARQPPRAAEQATKDTEKHQATDLVLGVLSGWISVRSGATPIIDNVKRALPILLSAVAAACGEDPMPITELIKTDTTVGSGNDAVAGRRVTVHYTGWLYDPGRDDKKGPKFDSSRDRNDPFSFRLGAGEVIQGWDEGVAGMKVGGRRTLTIPPALGYGARGFPPDIPPNSTLLFDVELLDVR